MKLPTRYKQISPPNPGGFGHTIICIDNHLKRKVIVKEITDSSEADRLIVEIEALQKAKSKHVVQIYDVITSEEGDLAIVEEFLPGNDLIGYRPDQSKIRDLIGVLHQLASGLADIHDCGIVHRDFKPNNVKYDSEKVLKLFDFGLAKQGKLPASTLGLIGTYGYMAPELFLNPPVIDKPVDCYALGATVFEFVTGKTPACARKKPLPRALLPNEGISNYIDLGGRLPPLIDLCLAIDPALRPSMKVLKETLEGELLYGKHKATIAHDGKVDFLEEIGLGVKISRGSSDGLTISYNGYEFSIQEVSGDVYMNGVAVRAHQILAGSCVIILGRSALGGYRTFVTFDISHPEVGI